MLISNGGDYELIKLITILGIKKSVDHNDDILYGIKMQTCE
jgi:hypothetical protein